MKIVKQKRSRWVILSVFLLYFSTVGISQTLRSGNLFDEIAGIINTMPGELDQNYVDPSSTQLDDWNEMLAFLFAQNYAQAAVEATDINYVLYEYFDTESNRIYFVLENDGTNFWGTYVYYPNYCRPLAIQSPHPKFDFNTGKESIHVFRETEAMFFQMAGTHRCNQTTANTCSGTTQVCNDTDINENYKISDMAHTISSIFQATTVYLFSQFNDTYFISFHGFAKKASDPYVIISNGTRITPNIDYIDILDDNLYAEDNVLTFKIAHIDLSWTRLIGFTNTQGRHINASPDACHTAATSTNGRFIHLEQEKSRLRQDISGWNKVATALQNTFNCAPLAVETIHPFSVKTVDNTKVLCTWTSYFEIDNDYFEIQRSTNGHNWRKLSRINGYYHSEQASAYQFVDEKPLPGYSYYRLKQMNLNGISSYSSVQKISLEKDEIQVYPNPSSGLFTIEGLDIQSLRLYNGLYQEIFVPKIEIQRYSSFTIDLAALPDGLYFLVTKKETLKLFKY